MTSRRDRDEDEHEHEDQGVAFDWFKVLDGLVWASVTLIAILAVEYFVGLYVRERIARGAQRHLASAEAPSE